MKISLNYLKKYLDFELPPVEELIEKIESQLGALEEGVINLGEIYAPVFVAKVTSCTSIEGSDHLSLCWVDDGGKYQDGSIRNENGLIQVVCGAPNVKEGLLVAWLPPGSVVPSTFSKDKLVLESKELKGQVSHGMLASSKELSIDDDHSGILVIDVEAKPGDSFAKLYELEDYILDIENKMFTHRPDCFGLIGIAREVAGILNQPFHSPAWYLNKPDFGAANHNLPFKVENEIPSLVPRFSAISMDNLNVKKSPIQVRSYLSRLGIRPINSVVDATNLAMIETGQPLHAYDYAKLKELSGDSEVTITVRNPMSEEKVTLINDKTVGPSANSIVIAVNQPVGLGGVMGSTNSSISDSTKSIILEAASFDMFSIRRTSMELGIFSDAVTRFNKGQSPLQTTKVLKRTIELIRQLNGEEAVIASELVDNNNLPETTIARDSLHPPVKVEVRFINDRLGTNLSSEDMEALLRDVECAAEDNGSEITVTAPFWRTDLEIREDIVEEVGRLYGYNKIQMKPLDRSIKPVKLNPELELKRRLREVLSSAGANEVLTYSFVSKKLLADVNQDESRAYKLANSLSPDVEYYRLSLIPSLLAKVNQNIKEGFDTFSLFEIGKCYLTSEKRPSEHKSLALVYASKYKHSEASYYQASRYFHEVLVQLPVSDVTYQPFNEAEDLPDWLLLASKPFNLNRSALLKDRDKKPIGIVGEFSSQVIRQLKLPISCSGFEVDMEALSENPNVSFYHKLSKYPDIKQDMTLKVPSPVKFAEIQQYLLSELSERTKGNGFYTLVYLSIYQSKESPEYTNYSFRIILTDNNKTLKDNEVNKMLDEIAAGAADKLKAVRI